MKRIQRNWQKSIRFWVPLVLTALLCIAEPSVAQVPAIFGLSAPIAAPSVERQARSQYTSGQFAEAATLFQQAAQAYKAAGEPIRQALSLSNLSLSYQQLGQWKQAQQAIADSLALVQANDKNPGSLALAQALDIQGDLYLAQGQAEPALRSWETATALYTQQGKPDRAKASQNNQAQALQRMGLSRRAIALLDKVLNLQQRSTANPQQLQTLLQSVPASPETATALRILGESLQMTGNSSQARTVLERSLAIATPLQLSDAIALAQLSLGNTARAQSDPSSALKYYQQVASASPNLKVQAQVNQLSLLADTNQEAAMQVLLPQVQQQIEALPPSRTAIEARINLAQTMLAKSNAIEKQASLRIAQLLATAVQQAKDLGDPRTQSYALGTLGSVYEQTQQWLEAEKLTQQALQLGQQINAADIAYRWQWQLGRVLKAQGKNEGAIAAYKEAVSTIKSLRADIAAASPDVQFSFRDAVEPIHRQLVGLLVQSNQQEDLKAARDVIESLQLVELDNFFREACLNANPEQVDQVDQRAAVIYPIILEDQLAIILSLPEAAGKSQQGRNLRYYKTAVSREQIERLAADIREDLDQPNTLSLTLPQLQKMYDLLLRPEAAELAASRVETLVFILDGALRNLPMAALHDGKKFLLEQYSVAVTPGLQLLAPRALKQERLGVLVAGLDAARPPAFSALPYVETEVQKIKSEVSSQILFNQGFTNSAFQNVVASVPHPIVHLATHGQFSDQADDTFILTWNGKLKVNVRFVQPK